MKKLLPYILILIVLVGIFTPTHFTYAGWWDTLTDPSSIVDGIGRAIAVGILTFMSFITWLSGYFLNFVLKYTVIDMETNLRGLTGINIAWKVVRDLMNMAFIFLLVYEGIKMIIGLSDTTKVKKFISMIVLASLLVNFSLFFTKVLIDASNVVTIGFYKVIITPPADLVGPPDVSYGMSDPIMRALGLQSLYGKEGEADFAAGKGFGGILIFMIGSSLIFIIAAFVFFTVAILFIVRYVTLIILLMLSPVAYMGMALPFMKKYADDWWDALNSQLLFAPLYMILTWVTLTLMSSDGFVEKKKFTEIFNSGTQQPEFTSMGLILNFAVIIGLLLSSLIIAKSTSSKGSKHIADATGKLTSFAGGAVMGGAARFGRSTVGRAGNAIVGSERLKNLSYQKNAERKLVRDAEGNLVAKTGLGGFASRITTKAAIKTGDKAAKSTFDVRATGKFQDLSKAAGMNFGKAPDAKKVNFQKDLEAKAQKQADYAKLLKPTDAAKDKMKDSDEQRQLKENEARTKTEHDKGQKELDKMNKDQEELKKELEKAVLPESKAAIQEKITALENDIKTKSVDVEKLKTASKTAEESRKKAEQEIENLWESRVNAYAKTFENEKGMRWFKNIAKVGTGVGLGALTGIGGGVGGLGGSTFITTKSDNQEIARKVRGVLKEKKKPTKKELKETYGIEIADDEEKKEGDEDKESKAEEKTEEKPETPKTT